MGTRRERIRVRSRPVLSGHSRPQTAVAPAAREPPEKPSSKPRLAAHMGDGEFRQAGGRTPELSGKHCKTLGQGDFGGVRWELTTVNFPGVSLCGEGRL